MFEYKTIIPLMNARRPIVEDYLPKRPGTLTKLAAAVVVVVSFGMFTPVEAVDLSCHPDIFVKNLKPTAIKVLRIEYTHTNGDKSSTTDNEGLANKKLSKNEKNTWKSQKLQHASEGLPITSTRIEYKDDTSGVKNLSDPWGPAVWSKSFPHEGNCTSTTTYHQDID
jgi:hypothetical protein